MTRQTQILCNVAIAASLIAAFPARGTLFAQTGAEDLRLTVGKSIVIDYPSEVRQISTSNPEIVDASPVTSREILVHGRGLGAGTLIVWNKSGERTFYSVTVEANLDPLRRLLKETFPNEDIRVQSSRDSISLNGTVSVPQIGERAAALATPFGKTIVNNLQFVTPPVEKQILLRVKFAALDRSKASQFGINLISTGAANTPGWVTAGLASGSAQVPSANRSTSTSGGGASSTTNSASLSISNVLNIFAFRPDLNLGALIQALQTRNILQILAEPNLLTTNGKEASFLAGGEFPVPVLQGGANAGAVTVQFKEFGIRLRFVPLLTANGTIKMHLLQEVSDIDLSRSVTVSGFTVPGVSTRRAETDVELGERQSFIVAGLLENRDIENFSKIPGLGDLPVLGQLFKTRNVTRNNTELVMIVSPELAKPYAAGEKPPLPNFPIDFLVPVDPSVKQSEPKSVSQVQPKAAAASESEAQTSARRRWYSPWKVSN